MYHHCFLCDRYTDSTDLHHIFGGANKRKSEEDELMVWLCRTCHNEVHHGAHCSGELMMRLRQYGEKLWLCNNPDKTVEDFIKRYGRNYL